MKRLTTELAESVQQVLSNGELHVVPKARIYEQIADQVEQFILKELAPGDRLPTERDLARMLAVSRCSLRDALLRLEMLGVVDSRQGRGTVVREVDANALIPPSPRLLLTSAH